jgi:hypothetical protein
VGAGNSNGIPQPSKAGVRLQGPFGFGKTKDFDPFLLLDDFRNDNPAIDVWIRLSLKPNRTHAPPARATSLYSSTESEVVRELLFSLQLALQFPL